MAIYCLEKKYDQNSGVFEMHNLTVGCETLSGVSSEAYTNLGEHEDCQSALTQAIKINRLAHGCDKCTPHVNYRDLELEFPSK